MRSREGVWEGAWKRMSVTNGAEMVYVGRIRFSYRKRIRGRLVSLGLLTFHDDAEANAVMYLVGRQFGALGGAASPGGTEPAAAAEDALGARHRACRVFLHALGRVWAVPVLHPFVHVAVHVEQAEGVGVVAAHFASVALVEAAL